MAKKEQPKNTSENAGFSKPQGFTHGMVSDLDPHFQLKGSYADAQNIRLTNAEGDTFTVENIEGNSLFVDLADYPISIPVDQGINNNYPTFYDRGPNIDVATNIKIDNRCSIVGHVSYADQILLIIVGKFEYNRNNVYSNGDPANMLLENTDRTIFLLVDFNKDFEVTKVTDLRVCYKKSDENYPDLGMKQDIPVRVEAMIENHCISRIYWTDNVNSLKTLNIKQPELHQLTIESLDITPIMTPSQPVLDRTLHGSLPVGVYQYTFKYISENGGETTFSPLSNLYHVSDQSFSSSVTYGGGPRGNLGTQGFALKVYDCDQDFDQIEMYALFYDSLNQAPRVALVDSVSINGSTASFMHTNWNSEITQGLEEILIESNTWDVCKDIAIKDNILFAANLKEKKNWISEKEWNVKVMRWRILDGTYNDAMLTTNDTEVKHYTGTLANPTEISDGDTDANGFTCGYGKLIGIDYYPIASYPHLQYDGEYGRPMWIARQSARGAGLSGIVKNRQEYRYLSDRMTLGGESFNYNTSALGGCRVTFGLKERIADQTKNTSSSPYISATAAQEDLRTDFQDFPGDGNTVSATTQRDTVFKTSMSLGGSKDPHVAGNKRGYQRGETYRFGVQVYDLTGAPGNVLWIGDIETPQQHDILRQLRVTDNDYSPYKTTSQLLSYKLLGSSKYAQDHRLSYVYGHVVPPVDVEWFSARHPNSTKNLAAYVKFNGEQQGMLPNDGLNGGFTPSSPGANTASSNLRKALTNAPMYTTTWNYPWHMYMQNKDDNHYLLDMFVNFEFRIPSETCAKISGFRVVRAIRTEDDRGIVQQGLLNQTIQYGDATLDLEDGYDATEFSNEDNSAFDDDPVFVNAYNRQDTETPTDPTQTEQPEYNTYLNGYLGLAENSYYAYYGTGVSAGKATTGGNTEGKVFYWPEMESRKAQYTNQWQLKSYPVPNHTDPASHDAGGHKGTHYRMSAYFGGFDKMTRKESASGDDYGDAYNNYARTEVSGSIFTLDSPDSAFGIRPYNYREGDVLRIDSVLKLTDNLRYGHSGSNHVAAGMYWTNVSGYSSANYGDTPLWTPKYVDKTAQDGLAFASRREINEDYGILIAKYYCFDPYYGIGMEITGGAYAGGKYIGNNEGARPSSQGWYLPISAAKELSDGEIVPSGFFKKSRRVDKGRVHGFSNNTLGYVKTKTTSDGKWNYKVWAGVHAHLAKTVGVNNAAPVSGWTEAKQKKDYTYDTVSTMQMGLRSILIELNTKVTEVRKTGPGDLDTYFDINHTSNGEEKMDHSGWFAPYDLSLIYDYGSWNGGSDTAGPTGEKWEKTHWMTILTKYLNSSCLGSSGTNCNDKWKGYHAHQFLCSIVRKVTPYGGYTKGAIEKTRYIPCGNFHEVPIAPNDTPGAFQGHLSQVFGGDTFVNLYSHQKTSAPYMKKSMVRFKVFPVESYVNTDMRSGLNLNNGDTVVGKDMNTAPFSNDWLYNSVYSQENTIKSALMVDEDESCDNLDLPYEIAYSNTKILGQNSDAFRIFPINQFHDMEGQYGEINRIVNFKNEIYVLQDSAFSKLLVNPLSMLSDDSGTSLFTGTGETVENHIYISTKYGTRHRFSVAASEKALYFVDVNFGRLFRYDTEKLVSLGDALGQRNYLRYITKHWEMISKKICTLDSGSGALFGTASTIHPSNTDVWHGIYTTDINSKEKIGRNYKGDNPLKFIGINSIFDYTNKELMVTFHNSASGTTRRVFANPENLHSMGSTTDGQPISHSETLVYNEGINAFTSKYTVAPPQWLTGAQGAFILCPENQLSAYEIQNWSYRNTHGSYNQAGSNDSSSYIDFRVNPLRLWIWDKHDKGKKTHFFGEKIGRITTETQANINDVNDDVTAKVKTYDSKDYAHESYIVKVVNSEASDAKIFDNAEIIIRPANIPFTDIKYITDTSIDNVSAYSTIHDKTITIDEKEQIVINRRWDFNDSSEGWYFYDGTAWATEGSIINTGLTVGVTSVHHTATNNGKYFFCDEALFTAMAGYPNWHNTNIDVIQVRAGVEIWTGSIIVWDSTAGNSTPLSGTGSMHGRRVSGSAAGQWQIGDIIMTSSFGSTLTLDYQGDGSSGSWSSFRSPNNKYGFNQGGGDQLRPDDRGFVGKYNNKVRMRVKRTEIGSWQGDIFWTGTDIKRSLVGTPLTYVESSARKAHIPEPPGTGDFGQDANGVDIVGGIDLDFVILEWDMSDSAEWDDARIEQIRIDLDSSTGTYEVDWIEIIGLKASKYIDGVLKTPLRTDKSKGRTRGTWSKIKYSANTTEKFNIFAILAKYRKQL